MNAQLSIGHAPLREPSARLGDADYARRSEIECRVYLRMLKRLFPVPTGVRARLTVKSNRRNDGHERREVVLRYDARCCLARQYAFSTQAAAPERWDAIASAECSWLTRQCVYNALVRQQRLAPEHVPPEFRSVLPPPFAALAAPDSGLASVRPDASSQTLKTAIATADGNVRVVLDEYRRGRRSAVIVLDACTDEPVAVLSVNLPSASIELGFDELFVKTWSENEPLLAPMLASGLFEDTGRREPCGFVHASVWRCAGELLAAVVRRRAA